MSPDEELQRLKRNAIAENDAVELRRLAFIIERKGLASPFEEASPKGSMASSTGAPKELLAEIRRLKTEYGDDRLDRAWSQLRIAERWRRWNRMGLKSGPGCPLMLTGEHREDEHEDYRECRVPGVDHPRLWFRKKKPVVYTMQPYHLDRSDLPELMKYCERHELLAEITSYRCWYFPGSSVLVEIAPKNAKWWRSSQ